MIIKNITTPYKYLDGSDHDFFWGKGYKKFNYTTTGVTQSSATDGNDTVVTVTAGTGTITWS